MPVTLQPTALRYKRENGEFHSADCIKGDPGDGIPEGGTAGQVLKKTADGTEWAAEQDISGKLDKANAADEYDNTATYAIGKLCIHDNTLYECSTAIETAEAWNSSHWTATTIADVLARMGGSNVFVGDVAQTVGLPVDIVGWSSVTLTGMTIPTKTGYTFVGWLANSTSNHITVVQCAATDSPKLSYYTAATDSTPKTVKIRPMYVKS